MKGLSLYCRCIAVYFGSSHFFHEFVSAVILLFPLVLENVTAPRGSPGSLGVPCASGQNGITRGRVCSALCGDAMCILIILCHVPPSSIPSRLRPHLSSRSLRSSISQYPLHKFESLPLRLPNLLILILPHNSKSCSTSAQTSSPSSFPLPVSVKTTRQE